MHHFQHVIAIVTAGVAAAWGSAMVAVQGWHNFAQATGLPDLPKDADGVTTLTLSGVIGWLLLRTLPDMQRTSREESAANRDAIKDLGAAQERAADKIADKLDHHCQQQSRLIEAALACPTSKRRDEIA